MNLLSPLLKYKIKGRTDELKFDNNFRYNYISGLWEDKDGIPLIKKFIRGNGDVCFGETLITLTREGVDRSERSSDNLAETTITKTREGVDQSEVSIDYLFETRITETRESIDKSEIS